MRLSFLLASFFTLIAVPAFAQLFRNYTISPAYALRSHVPMDLGGGNTVYACDRAFGYDSSYVELLWTAPDQTVIGAACYKLSTSLTYHDHAAKLDDGILVSGLSYPSYPMLFKVDNTGAAQWFTSFTNLQNAQDQMIHIVPRGNEFSVYTYPSGTYAHDVYRIEGESTGATFTGKKINAAANFRVYQAAPTTDPLVQLVAGTANDDAAPTHLRAMLMLTDTSGASWMKLYDMGTTFVQDLYGILPLADGNYLCSGYFQPTGGSTFKGVLLKVDVAGTVLWCKHYTDVSNGLLFQRTTELPNGEILVAGVNAQYQGLLVKLSTTGDPIWTKLHPSDRLTGFFTSGSNVKLIGPGSLIELDASGEGCDLSASTNVTTTAYTPLVTSITVSNSTFAPITIPLTPTVRTPALSWTPGCIWNAIDGPTPSEAIDAHPVPTTSVVHLGEPGQVAPNEHVILTDVTGAVHFDGTYATGIDLSDRDAGAYIVTLPAMRMRAMVMKQ